MKNTFLSKVIKEKLKKIPKAKLFKSDILFALNL